MSQKPKRHTATYLNSAVGALQSKGAKKMETTLKLTEELLALLRQANGVTKNGYNWVSCQETRSLIYSLQDWQRKYTDLSES